MAYQQSVSFLRVSIKKNKILPKSVTTISVCLYVCQRIVACKLNNVQTKNLQVTSIHFPEIKNLIRIIILSVEFYVRFKIKNKLFLLSIARSCKDFLK